MRASVKIRHPLPRLPRRLPRAGVGTPSLSRPH